MRSINKTAVIGAIVFLLLVLTALQIQAQTPTVTPETPTVTSEIPTATTEPVTPAPAPATKISTPIITHPQRQAVVKRSIDGDSVEVVFTDDGEIAVVHLVNVDAPESVKTAECFGRESAEYAVQAYRSSPLISIELVGGILDGEGEGYVHLADGTLLNLVMVLFGYAKFDDSIESIYTAQIKSAEDQSRQGKTGLWRACGETEKPPRPCFLFSDNEMDSASSRGVRAQIEDALDISAWFKYAYYDPVQNEIIVSWKLTINGSSGKWWVDEYYRLPECLRDRSVMVER